MSDIPTDLGYRESHEWVRAVGDGTAVIGISDHAQSALGDMVYVELPEPGLSYEQGDACAVVESVKAASDIYAPVSGEELRGQIREEADVRVSQVSEEWDKALNSMQKALDDTSKEIRGYIEQAKAEEEVEIQEEV